MRKINSNQWVVIIEAWHKDYFLCVEGDNYYRTDNLHSITFFDDITTAKDHAKKCQEKRAHVRKVNVWLEIE